MSHSVSTLRLFRHLPLACLLLLLGAGCHLGRPGSASFASVPIQNHPVAEINTTLVKVFRAHGYTGYVDSPTALSFEREGTRGEDISYNGVVGAHYGGRTLVRVKTEIVDLGAGASRLQCQAYMVRAAGDSFYEEEIRVANFRSGPYQDILNEVAKQLK